MKRLIIYNIFFIKLTPHYLLNSQSVKYIVGSNLIHILFTDKISDLLD